MQIGGDHYRNKGIYQPWDVMEAWMSFSEFKGFLKGNVIKYLARADDKGGLQDLQKAQHYLAKLIEIETADSKDPQLLKHQDKTSTKTEPQFLYE
jgi:hypothetical protein